MKLRAPPLPDVLADPIYSGDKTLALMVAAVAGSVARGDGVAGADVRAFLGAAEFTRPAVDRYLPTVVLILDELVEAGLLKVSEAATK